MFQIDVSEPPCLIKLVYHVKYHMNAKYSRGICGRTSIHGYKPQIVSEYISYSLVSIWELLVYSELFIFKIV